MNNAEVRTVHLVLHANSIWNEAGKTQGHRDTPLSKRGYAMAERLGLREDLQSIRTLVSSDLRRAIETVLPLSRRLGIPIQKFANLREGRWAHSHEDPEFPLLAFPVASETPEDVKRRSWKTLQELVASDFEFPMLLVTHGGFLRSFLEQIVDDGTSLEKPVRTAINTLRYESGKWQLVSLNDDRHLEGLDKASKVLDFG